MWRDEIHQRALRAAARATVSVAALGCGASGESGSGPPQAPRTARPAAAPTQNPPGGWARVTPGGSGQQPAPGAYGAQPASCLSGSAGPYSKAQVDCCAQVVKSLPYPGFPVGTMSAEQNQCCQLIVTESDAMRSPGAEIGLTRSDSYRCCLYQQPMPDGPTCSPWGPPMPPAMLVALLDEVRSA